MRKDAIRRYVRNEFESRELMLNSGAAIARTLNESRALVSEVLYGLFGRDYRYTISKYGFGLALNGTAQLDEVVRRFRQKLRYLYVHPYSKQWLRQDESLDFALLTPLSGLRGLSVGYMLNSRNASAIEKLSSLEYLSLAWKIDESADLQKLSHLRELAILASPHLESVWNLRSLRKLAISHYYSDSLDSASRLASVEKLTISESAELLSIKGIGELHKLRFLGLYGNSNLSSLQFLSGAQSLEYIVIEKCSRLENIDEVAELPNLKYLEVRDCSHLKSVDAFPAQLHLTHVFFMGRTKPYRAIEEIVDALPNLKYFYG